MRDGTHTLSLGLNEGVPLGLPWPTRASSGRVQEDIERIDRLREVFEPARLSGDRLARRGDTARLLDRFPGRIKLRRGGRGAGCPELVKM